MEKNWINENISLGRLKEGTRVEIVFKGTQNMKQIMNVVPSCGCTAVHIDNDKKQLNVSYKVNGIPYHLNTDELAVTKNITVNYIDGTSETLKFNNVTYK